MTELFKNPALQAEFDKNGFVKVPLLNPQQAGKLLHLYDTLRDKHNQIGLPFTTTSHSNNNELIREADSYIAGVLAPEMDKALNDYNLLFGNFLIKQPGPDSVTPLHQDTTFVDETRHSSVSVWVALQDTNRENGCMRFIKGSHKFKFGLRPTQAYQWPFEGVKDELEKLLTDYPAKKGEAFIFHHAVIHASYANLSASPRVAAVMAAYPADAELLLFFMEKEGSGAIRKYKMSKEAYLHFVKGQPPAMGELLETLDYDSGQISPAEFETMQAGLKSPFQKFAARLSIFKRNKTLTG